MDSPATLQPPTQRNDPPGSRRGSVSMRRGTAAVAPADTRTTLQQAVEREKEVFNKRRDKRGSDAGSAASEGTVHDDGDSPTDAGTCGWGMFEVPPFAEALNYSSMFVLSGTNKFRIFIYNVSRHKIFEGIVILLIASNCVFLALDRPLEPDPPYKPVVEVFYIVAFTLEMVLKWVAYGVFAHPGSYIRNPWNVLDFIIVLLSYVGLLPQVGNLTAFRVLRVLRPLRSMNAIRGLQALVIGLMASMKGLVHVGILAFFVILVFSILGVQTLGGSFDSQCYSDADGWTGKPCKTSPLDTSGYWGFSCTGLQEGMECRSGGPRPYYDLYHFDNVLSGMACLFTIITFDNWGSALIQAQGAVGMITFLYFFFFIVAASYFVPNLMLAVINDEFVKATELAEQQHQEQLEKEERLRQQQELKALTKLGGDAAVEDAETASINTIDAMTPEELEAYHATVRYRVLCQWHHFRDVLHQFTEGYPRVDSPNIDALIEQKRIDDERRRAEAKAERQAKIDALRAQAGITDDTSGKKKKKKSADDEGNAGDEEAEDGSDAEDSEDEEDKYPDEPPTPLFGKIIVVFIILNTALLASQADSQPEWLDSTQKWGNFVLTIVFAIEFVLRLTAMGPIRYGSDPFNLLDGAVVIVSMVELGLSGSSTASVFRALRLLRVLKLLRNFPSLRQIIQVTLIALKDTSFLLLIVALFLFIGSLVGTQFFAGAVVDNRAKFDDFVHSFYTVFQILTLDGWTALSYELMYRTTPAAFIFFVIYIILGFYVLLSLFLAILLSSFDSLEVEAGNVENENQISYKLFDMSVAQTIFGRGAATKEEMDDAEWVDPKTCMNLTAYIQREQRRARHVLCKSPTKKQQQVAEDFNTTFGGSEFNGPLLDQNDASPPTAFERDAVDGFHAFDSPRAASAPRVLVKEPERTPTMSRTSSRAKVVGEGETSATNRALGDSEPDDDEAARSKSLWQWPAWRDGHFILPVEGAPASGSPGQSSLHPVAGTSAAHDFSPTSPGMNPLSAPPAETAEEKRQRELQARKQSILDMSKPKSLFEIDQRYTITGQKRAVVPKPANKAASSNVLVLESAPPPKDAAKKEEDPTEIFCPVCGQEMVLPLPSAPLVRQTTRKELHKVQCNFVATRVAKTAVLDALADIVEMYIAVGQPTKYKYVDPIIGQAWQVGFLLSETPESFCEPNGWYRLQEEIEEERDIVKLRVGEEQLGRSLIAYALGNVPTEFKTNGGWSCFFFGPRNPLRVALSRLVQNEWFDRIVLIIILANTGAMAADSPLDDPNSDKSMALQNLDYAFTAAFTLEMTFKVIAFGFVFHEGAYLRDPWNCMDCFIVFVSLLSLALTNIDISVLKVFRTLRTLRPLRVVNRNRGLKMVVRTLLESVKGIANVALISGITYLIFGILAVQWWGGNFKHCTDSNVTTRAECNGTFFNAQYNTTWDRQWVSEDRNFDNIINSMLTLFEISSGENWEPVMFRAMDDCDPDKGPQLDCNLGAGMFFVVFFAVTGFFILNLFVGVVIHNFNEVKEQLDGSTFMSEEQKLWVSTQQLILNFRPEIAMKPRSGSDSAAFVYARVISRPWFDILIGSAIMLNIVALALDTADPDPTMSAVLGVFNNIFTFVFVVEAMLKLYVFGMRYFLNGWNQFDFFLVVIGLVTFVITQLGTGIGINVSVLRVFRIFRILRILRLVRQAKKIKILLATIWYSLPSMANIGAFILLVDFMYGILGVQIFAKLDITKDMYVLDDKVNNFQSLDRVIMMLFRFSTVTDWDMAMHDCMRQPPYCDGDGCGTPFAPAYFVSHLVVTSFVITNLLIAIILDNFETTMKLDNSALRVQDLNRFIEIWSEFDEDATMTIPTAHFAKLLAQLQPPLGLTRLQSRTDLLTTTSKYRIPEHGGVIHFIETLIPLARTVKLEEPGEDHLVLTDRDVREHETLWKLTFPNLTSLPTLRYRQHTVTVDQYYGSNYIGAAYRTHVAQRRAHRMRLEKIEALMKHCDENGVAYESVPYIARHMNYYIALRAASGHSLETLPAPIDHPVAPEHRAGVLGIAKALATISTRGAMPSRQAKKGHGASSNDLTKSRSGTASRSPDQEPKSMIPVSGPGSDMAAKRYPSALKEVAAAEEERRRRHIPLVRSTNRKRVAFHPSTDNEGVVCTPPMAAVGPSDGVATA